MKAVLLAAGKGERLGEVTQRVPKPMLAVLGKPVIVHNIEMCRRFGITDIYINLHHLPEVITGYLGDGKRFGVSITYSREETILGTAGGVKCLAEHLLGDRFFVIYADNYYNYDLGMIHERHCKEGAQMSIALFELEDVSQSGVAFLDEGGWIQKFVEKPGDATIAGHWVNAGIYLMEPELLDLIPAGFSDFGQEIIPRYIADGHKVLGVKMPAPVVAMDTPALLEEVERQAQMKKDKPLVSVLITTCNRAGYLDKCLSSVLSQDFKDYEVLIMDDESEDDTESVVKKYAPMFNIGANYRHIRNAPRLGYQRSLNRGLREARGDYIARLDDDDAWVDVDKLRQQVEFLDTHPEYVLVGTGVIVVDEDGTELSRKLLPGRDDEIRERMLQENCFIHSSVMYRKSAAMEFGGYIEPEDPFYSEDQDLWLKLGTVGKLTNLPIYGVAYTGTNRGIVYTLKARFIPAARHIRVIRKFKDEYPHHWQATLLQFPTLVEVLLGVVLEVPPFIHLKRFVRTDCPACWRGVIFAHKIVFQGIRQVISGISRVLNKIRKR